MARFHINPETGTPNACSARPGNCRFGGEEDGHYGSKEEARVAYETLQVSSTFFPKARTIAAGDTRSVLAQDEIYTFPEHTRVHGRSPKGVTFSASVNFEDGSFARMIAGSAIHFGPERQVAGQRTRAITQGTVALGDLMQDPVSKKWTPVYPDSTSGRASKSITDAVTALVAKNDKKNAPRTPAEPTPARGYEPEASELERHELVSPKKATTGRLRRMTSEDLGYLYNRHVWGSRQAWNASEIDSSERAMARIEKVLRERNMRLVVAKKGGLQPGNDFSDPDSYTVAPD